MGSLLVAAASRPDATREIYDRGSAWIVCAGATRKVSHGRVHCPRRGTVSAIECLACHLLVTVADERNPRRACSIAG